MITAILLFSIVLFILVFTLKINSIRKVKILNHILATIFLLVLIFSTYNIINQNTQILLNWLFSIWALENYFLLIFSVLWIAVSFYSDFYFWEYFKDWKNLRFYYIFLLLFIFSMFWVIISNEAITFLIFWEIMSVSSYFLVVHDYSKKWVLKDGAWYVIITHIWMFFILLSFIPFILKTGSTSFSDWSGANLSVILASLVYFSALIWFGSKAWLFPIHIWLPKAHPIAPTNVSALMSWFMVKLPVLMILKVLIVFLWMKVQFSWFIITLIVASISAFLWVFYALIQHNIKKLLAFHTVENIWIIFLWIAISIFGMYVQNNTLILIWIFASLYHTFNHAIFKWLLFLVAWWMIERTWTYEYTKLWALIKYFPFLALSFLIWAIAIAWIMPLNWFNSELLTYVWLFKLALVKDWFTSILWWIIALIMLSATAVLSLICFTKIFWIAFLWNKRDEKLEYKQINSIWEKISYSILMLAIFILAILPWFIYLVVSKILNIKYTWNLFTFWSLDLSYTPIFIIAWLVIFAAISYLFYKLFSKKEIEKPVWNCGYSYIEPKTQYTASSFIQPLRKIFATIYWETTMFSKNQKDIERTYYKKHLSHIEYSKENKYFIENIYDSILKYISYIAKKVKSLQNWELQSYIFYIFLALIVLVVLVVY